MTTSKTTNASNTMTAGSNNASSRLISTLTDFSNSSATLASMGPVSPDSSPTRSI